MNRISRDAAFAFNTGRRFKRSNTEVVTDGGGVFLYLFDNMIAKKIKTGTYITHAGWKTKTTQARLCALGVRIRKCKNDFVLNEQLSMENQWYKI